MNEEELFLEWLKNNNMDDIDESEYSYWRESAQFQAYLLRTYINRIGLSLTESMQPIVDIVVNMRSRLFDSINDVGELPRPPEEIKKQIKYEKNPMRLKQLNRELNESYKVYRKKVKYERQNYKYSH